MATRTVKVFRDGQLESEIEETISDEMNTRETVEARARQAILDNQAFLAIVTPTAGQSAAQVRRLTRQVNALLRLALSDFASDSDT